MFAGSNRYSYCRTFSYGFCSAHKDYRISQAINKGVDPIVARFAYEKDGRIERMKYLYNIKNEVINK